MSPLTVATTALASAAPALGNMVCAQQSFTVTTGATTLVTVPAGRTWSGTIGASVTCQAAAASTISGQAVASFSVAGAGVTPAAGSVLVVRATCGANVLAGLVGTQSSNFGWAAIAVAAPAGNAVTIAIASTNTGSASAVDAFASGQLI